MRVASSPRSIVDGGWIIAPPPNHDSGCEAAARIARTSEPKPLGSSCEVVPEGARCTLPLGRSPPAKYRRARRLETYAPREGSTGSQSTERLLPSQNVGAPPLRRRRLGRARRG